MKLAISQRFLLSGFIPLPAWLGFVTLAGFFATDYNWLASHASVMTLQEGIAPVLTNIAGWVTGVSLILFGIAIWRFTGRIFSGSGVSWILFGISMIANGTWPMGTPMHGLYIIGIFNIIAPAVTLLEVNREAYTTRLLAVTVWISLANVLYLWILLNGFDPQGYQGLTQRLFATVGYLWPALFALAYWRLSHSAAASSVAP